MNNYSRRSEYYKYEFNSTQDFPLLSDVIRKNTGTVVEIPCGSGRLVPFHSTHNRRVLMLDLEPNMVSECQNSINKFGLEHRLNTQQGELSTFSVNTSIDLILCPRGGMQLLASENELKNSLNNFKENIEKSGLVYIDLSNPWNCHPDYFDQLPEFMRFHPGQRRIEGQSRFNVDQQGLLIREYNSILEEDYISTHLTFKVELFNQANIISYESIYRWIKIEHSIITLLLEECGFEVLNIYGDYLFGEVNEKSPRFVYLAKSK